MLRPWILLAGIVWPLFVPMHSSAKEFDVLLQNGTIVDGTGSPRYFGDIGVRDGEIAAIGDLDDAKAERVISAKGLVVAPGLIDMMGQAATPMLDNADAAMNLLTQGITTINAGQGDSAAPLSEGEAKHSRWLTMAEYFQTLDMKGLPINVVQTVGHTQVRRIVVDDSNKRPSRAEMDEMKALVREAMEAGAIGLSSSLIDPPAVYADTQEIGELAAIAGEYGGRYYTHIRNEGDGLLEAMDEALEIGRVGHLPVHVFHLKAAGKDGWPKMQQVIDKIQAARAAGQAVTADIYPYTHNGLGISSFIHTRTREQDILSLEQAIAQASAVGASYLLRSDRGRIARGLAADLIVFDYEKLSDLATVAEPGKTAEGMRYVLVGGCVVLDEGKLTGARPGRVLRGPGYDPGQAPPAVSTGKSDPRTASFDRMMTDFMVHHHVPGAALAVTDHGRLVYARGYGYGDVAKREKVEPTSLFRIASISKPITAVAVLQLVEQGRLNLDDKVFDLLGWSAFTGDGCDERLRSVSVRHLLQHRGGWDRAKSFDAMFQSVRFAQLQQQSPPAGPDAIIRSMFTQRLDFNPGEGYAYSNYGYCLLGRIIEKLTGQSYEEYVKEHVLEPLGIQSMVLGRSRLDERRDSEVRYYDPDAGRSVFARDLDEPVAHPYGAWCLEAMDAHGGWLASAVDLARFACAFDEPEQCRVLRTETVSTMYARPIEESVGDADTEPPPVYYSCGWQNRAVEEGRFNRWHNGSLPGTSTLLVRRHDGRNWVLLLNSRVSPHSSELSKEADPLLHRAADEVTEWPEYDLFDDFQ